MSAEETLEAARKFQLQTRAIIRNFDKKFVINTDQTACQYQSTYNRTLAERNSKTVFVRRCDMNKVTHSYTAQYAITLCGELLPHVFLCLREATGNFGPKVQNTVDKLTKDLPNVVVTSSKSGKLTTQLYCSFLSSVMLPYVKKEKFLLIIDSWGVKRILVCTTKFSPMTKDLEHVRLKSYLRNARQFANRAMFISTGKLNFSLSVFKIVLI